MKNKYINLTTLETAFPQLKGLHYMQDTLNNHGITVEGFLDMVIEGDLLSSDVTSKERREGERTDIDCRTLQLTRVRNWLNSFGDKHVIILIKNEILKLKTKEL